MEILRVILLIAASAGSSQEVAPIQPPRTPEIVITKWSWKEYSTLPGNVPSSITPRNNNTNPRSREPFGAKDSLEGARTGESVTVKPQSRDNRPAKNYQYRVTVKNTGAKTIKSMIWNYFFIDPGNQDQVAHHRFQSEKKIKPGKEAQLIAFSPAPPSRVINVDAMNKTAGEPFIERVIVSRIEYIDGSVWLLTN